MEFQNQSPRPVAEFSSRLVPRLFWIGFILFHVLGIAQLAIVLVWILRFKGGFSWQTNPSIQFNFHPFFMTLGLIYLNGQAALFYRLFRKESKLVIKQLHAAFQATAFCLMVVAAKAAFDSHDLRTPPIPNLYSLHSWLGISTIIAFSIQLVFGFITFLFPKLSERYRRFYLPIHVFSGAGIFISAIATALTGITEKLLFSVPNYSDFPPEAILVNLYGIVLVLFAIVTLLLLINEKFKRPEEVLEVTSNSKFTARVENRGYMQ